MKTFIKYSTLLVLLLSTAQLIHAQTLFKANWIEPNSVTINADLSLTRPSAGSSYGAGAVSDNILPALTSGYVQFTYVASGSVVNRYAVGLSTFEKNTSFGDNQFTIQIDGTAVTMYHRGVAAGTTTAAAGDIFKASREGTEAKFYKNGTVLFSVNTAVAEFNLRVDASIRGGTMPPVYCSFDRTIVPRPTLQLPTHLSNGAISLDPEGGVAPYTYTWSSGENTASISNKPRGIYSVTIKDAAGRTAQATYNLFYNIGWKNLVNVTVDPNNILVNQIDASWASGASSTNILPAGVDGWIEFTITGPLNTLGYAIGFSNNFDPNTRQTLLRYGLYVTANGAVQAQEGNTATTISSIVKGDRFRISREGAQIIYYRNGSVIRSIAGPTNKPAYIVDVAIAGSLGPLPLISTSFDKRIMLRPVITPADENNTGGSITVEVLGAYTPAVLTWSNGETGNTLTNKPRGQYSLTLTDASGRTKTVVYNIGYPAQWNLRDNIVINLDATIKKKLPTNTDDWNAGAISSNRLPGGSDGWAEIVMNRQTTSDVYMVGLAQYNTTPSYTTLDYCFYFENDGTVSIRESSVNVLSAFSYLEGSVFRVARSGTSIYYSVNDSIVRTVPNVNASRDLYADFSIKAGSTSQILTSFNYTPRMFYAITNGPWTTAANWSLTENGTPVTQAPGYGDRVFVKGRSITINTGISCQSLEIRATDANTNVMVDGAAGALIVKEAVKVKGENNQVPVNAFQVQNSASFNVQ